MLHDKTRITSITIENFKGISEAITIPLRPITLLFGKNSVGKSAILQTILYAKEILKTGKADIDKLYFAGDVINLGGFPNYVNKHDLSKSIKLKFDLELDSFGLEISDEFPPYTEIACETGEKQFLGVRNISVEFIIFRGNVTEYTVWISGEKFASVEKRNGKIIITDIELSNPIVTEPVENQIGAISNEDGTLGYLEFKYWDTVIPKQNQNFHSIDTNYCYHHGDIEFEEEEATENIWLLPVFFAKSLGKPVDILRQQLENIFHIGPIRDIPDNNYNNIQENGNSWSNGLAAWNYILKASSEDTPNNFFEKINHYISLPSHR